MIDFSNIQNFLFNGYGSAVAIVIILAVTVFIERIIKKLLNISLKKSSRKIKVEPTKYNFLRHSISTIIYLMGISIAIFTIPQLRAISLSIFAGAGILAVIIGFASQQAFSNIVSGIFIVAFKPFRVGDRIKIGTDITGKVEDITLRHTVIRSFQNNRIIIPNSKISDHTIENFDIGDKKICKWIEIGISYDSDINKAIRIMREEAMKHPNFIDNRTEEEKKNKEPAVNVRVLGFGDSSVNLRAWVWAEDPGKGFVLACDLNKSIKERFDKEGVEIPFPYRTVVFKDKFNPTKRLKK